MPAVGWDGAPSGIELAQAIGAFQPYLLGGWIMDHGLPRFVFYASVAFMLMTVAMALASEHRTRRRGFVAAAE